MTATLSPAEPEERAIWHLELLGCFSPEDARAPWVPLAPSEDDAFDDWDEDDDFGCTRCGDEGYSEVDDPMWDECDEFGWGPCACRGTGERRHQWVF